jgi:hypothetical protein
MDGQVVGAAGDGDGDPLSGRAMAGAWDRAVASALPGCPTNWITSPGGSPAWPGDRVGTLAVFAVAVADLGFTRRPGGSGLPRH